LAEGDVLDFGVRDPNGLRGWGGGNPEPAIIGVTGASRSYRPGPLPAGQWEVLVGLAKVVSGAPAYRVEIELRAVATLPAATDRAPWVDAPLRTGPAWYGGDTHVHSEDSGDASPTLDAVDRAASLRGLDFVVVTDHNTDSHVDRLRAAQRDVLLVPGVEFTTYAGHATGFGATRYVPHTLGFDGVDVHSAAAAFDAQGTLLSINHPTLDLGGLCIGCAWTAEVPDGLGGVEIQTGGYAKTGAFLERSLAFWDALCDDGHHLAALGGSDDHRAGAGDGAFDSPIGSPTTRIWAEELSVAALSEGIRASRTVVQLDGPDGPMVELDTEPARVGDTVRGADIELSARVTGLAGGVVRWVRDGQVCSEDPVDSDDVRITAAAAQSARYRVELVDADGVPRAVTSHVWVELDEQLPTPQACGCRTGWGGLVAGPVWVMALALRRRQGRA
jgi:hypothetical protein